MFCTNICPRCTKHVHVEKDKRFALGRTWHKLCFTCIVCSRMIDKYDLATHVDEIYCRRCYHKLFNNCPCSVEDRCRECRGPPFIRERQEKKPAPIIRNRILPYIWECSKKTYKPSIPVVSPPVKLQPLYMTGTIMDCLQPPITTPPYSGKAGRFTLQECIQQNLLGIKKNKKELIC